MTRPLITKRPAFHDEFAGAQQTPHRGNALKFWIIRTHDFTTSCIHHRFVTVLRLHDCSDLLGIEQKAENTGDLVWR